MVGYRRNFIPGGTFFFTVTLADRRSSALVDHIGALRAAFRVCRRERPFTIDAIVILPDHLHAIFTLPSEDVDFSGRWRRIKGHFSRHMIALGASPQRHPNVITLFGKDGSGNTPFAMMATSPSMSITFTSIRSSTASCHVCAIGRIRRFTCTYEKVCCPMIGQAKCAKACEVLVSPGNEC